MWPYKRHEIIAIVPAYNEEDNIANVVQDIQRSAICDILVIDDGSTDRTQQAAIESGTTVLSLPYNLGIGGAVQAGLKYASQMRYAYVIRLDGDGQHQFEESRKVLEAVINGDADIAIGSRFIPGHRSFFPSRSRYLGIRWFAILVSWITRSKAYDTTSGMQAMRLDVCNVLADNYPQDYPEVEARILLHKCGFKVVEVPVKMKPRGAGVSSITYFRSIYYAIKVTLATLMASLRESPAKPR